MQNDSILIVKSHEVAALLEGREEAVLAAVRRAYEIHAAGHSSLPFSSFLRFPDSDADRIISLPAYLGEELNLAGLKWIASVPSNLGRGIERASAVVILNDRTTGRPRAILEGSLISKQRTAASAALAASVLRQGRQPAVAGFVGCGPINLEVAKFLGAVWPDLRRSLIYDLSAERAASFADGLRRQRDGAEVTIAGSLDEVLARSELVTFATTAIEPHVDDLSACAPGTTILHVSLRDLTPEVILAHHNVVDDVEHVARARTSIHLAAELRGDHAFVHATLGEILLGRAPVPDGDPDRLHIFSPFGLGVLDLAVAQLVCDRAQAEGRGSTIDSFLP